MLSLHDARPILGLSAYASHVAVGAGQAALLTGAAIAFGHGLALAALSRQARRRMAVLALAAILAGTLLFSSGLVVAHFTGAAARTAPFGGSLRSEEHTSELQSLMRSSYA